jgi:hypothetical protein
LSTDLEARGDVLTFGRKCFERQADVLPIHGLGGVFAITLVLLAVSARDGSREAPMIMLMTRAKLNLENMYRSISFAFRRSGCARLLLLTRQKPPYCRRSRATQKVDQITD